MLMIQLCLTLSMAALNTVIAVLVSTVWVWHTVQSACGLYNETYLVCTVCASVAASKTKHTWSVQQSIPGLYSGCQHNNKTYLVCTECASLVVEAKPSGHCCPTWLGAAGWWCPTSLVLLLHKDNAMTATWAGTTNCTAEHINVNTKK